MLSTYSNIHRNFGGDTHYRAMTKEKCLSDTLMAQDDIKSKAADETQAMTGYDGANFVRGNFVRPIVAPQIITSNNIQPQSGPVRQGRNINLVFPGTINIRFGVSVSIMRFNKYAI